MIYCLFQQKLLLINSNMYLVIEVSSCIFLDEEDIYFSHFDILDS